jgi:hypothetical protein
MISHREGLRPARFLMVLASMSPLFILWAIQGVPIVPDRYFVGACIASAFLPNAFLLMRIRTAQRLQERRELTVGKAEDHRDHLLVYLFAMLLPLYVVNVSGWRPLSAVIAALAFVMFLFWHLNLHYMNILFAARGYRVFTIHPPSDANPLSGKSSVALITKRLSLSSGDHIVAYRLSDTVYFE